MPVLSKLARHVHHAAPILMRMPSVRSAHTLIHGTHARGLASLLSSSQFQPRNTKPVFVTSRPVSMLPQGWGSVWFAEKIPKGAHFDLIGKECGVLVQ